MMYRFPHAQKNPFATAPDAGCRFTRVFVPTMNKARGGAPSPGGRVTAASWSLFEASRGLSDTSSGHVFAYRSVCPPP